MLRLLLFLVLLLPTLAGAQAVPEKPLRFVDHESVLFLTQSSDNIVLRLLGINPFIRPERTEVSAAEAERLRQLHATQPSLQGRTAEEVAQLFLVSGDLRYALALDSLRQTWLPELDVDSLQHEAARRLFNSLCWTAATDDRGLFVNFFDDCMINVRTDSLRFTLDQINEVTRMKYRISGLPDGRTPLVIRLRLPSPAPEKIYLNGRSLLAPKFENGYLVLDRSWRDYEEIYYDLPE